MKKFNDVCKICNSQIFQKEMKVIDFTVSRETFDVARCSDCGFCFTQFVSDNKLDFYYQSDEYISHTDSAKGLFNSLYQLIRKYTLFRKYSLINSYTNVRSLFDFGCGTGHFLAYAKSKGIEVSGIEVSDSAREIARITVNSVYSDIDSFSNSVSRETFDAITLWHVLEHIDDLNETIEFLKSKMHDKSYLFVAVPNHRSYDAKYYKAFWAAYDVPRHLYHFDPKSIAKLFEKHGMKVIDMKPMWFDSFYVSMLSEKYRTGRINYIKAFWIGLISNMKAYFNNGQCSSQIYIITK
jgi:2-polyprenyl-3-methyl-5-hydroxy-6-metoxy-1,4-benzoquinol methylase